jgi:hypothetical protein
MNEEKEQKVYDDLEDETSEDQTDVSTTESDFEPLLVAPTDWTVESLLRQIGKQIDLDPDFQRRNVWNHIMKSRFIESLLLNIPIPQILLAAKKGDRNSFIVLDGKQRLLAIKQFHDGFLAEKKRFRLKGMRILKSLEKKDWKELQSIDHWSDRFLNATQRTTVLRGWQRDDVLYEIFYRLNAQTVKLSPMELRLALYPGPFLKHIISWTEQPNALRKLLKLNSPHRRMDDVELVVRYLAFSCNGIPYEGNLKKFLDDACRIYGKKIEEDGADTLGSALHNFNEAVDSALKIFGPEHVCRKWKNGHFEGRFNRAVFDIIVGSLSNEDLREWALNHKDVFKDCYIRTSGANLEFVSSLETTTKSVKSVSTRFSTWFDAISAKAGIALKLPRIADALSN